MSFQIFKTQKKTNQKICGWLWVKNEFSMNKKRNNNETTKQSSS